MRLIDADALRDWLASYAKHGVDDHLRRNAKDLMEHVAEQPTVLDTPTEDQFAAGKARIAELEAELKHLHSRWTWTEYWFDNLYPADWERCQAKYDRTKTGARPVGDG